MPTTVRWNPRTSMARSPRTLEQAFDALWRDFGNQQPSHANSDTARPILRPAMDVVEGEDAFTV